ERLLGVVGAPAPLRVDHPEGDVGVDDDGGAGGEPGDVLLEPVELLLAQRAQPVLLEVQDVDEADEVDAVVVEALPAAAGGPLAVAREVLRAVVAEDVVLAGDVED